MKNSLNKGFTLIEILVVVVIIGLLVAVGISRYAGVKDRAMAATAKSITSTLNTTVQRVVVDENYAKLLTGSALANGALTKDSMGALARTLNTLGYITSDTVTQWENFVESASTADTPIIITVSNFDNKYTLSFSNNARSDELIKEESTGTVPTP